MSLQVRLCIGTFLLVALSAFCGSATKTKSSKPAKAAPRAGIDVQALAMARNYWNSHTSKCGEAYAARVDDYQRSGGNLEQHVHVAFRITPRPLTEADRLNGLEYDGVAFGTSSARRTSHYSNFMTTTEPHLRSPESMRPQDGHSTPGQWSQWQTDAAPFWGVHVVKSNGTWSVGPTQLAGDFAHSSALYFEPWPCDQLPEAVSQ
jgi:hypothetical protein